ncbi:unnamed protein product [Heligmosomoides polygyrus]|uniref:ANK_REP_REGION domain-containing protein n=1 Tax=Heligmosomoides polygyrus TaxID=6339 RepID=A0A183FUF9_HELPZ|nr:unnamed protein product [Heligmosomoides polygyrus]
MADDTQPFDLFYFMSSRDFVNRHRVEDAPSELVIDEWIANGEVGKLEQLVLDGRGHLLKWELLLISRGKTTINAASKEFLRGLTVYQSKIDAIHKAVEDGDVRRVNCCEVAQKCSGLGMTPLHKALLHGQTNTVRHLLAKYPQCVNATDHVGPFCIFIYSNYFI